MKKNISLFKVREDNPDEIELYNNLCFKLCTLLFCTNPDLAESTEKPEEILWRIGEINEQTEEELERVLNEYHSYIEKDIIDSFFILIDSKVSGFITADLSGIRSVMIIEEVGLCDGISLDDDEFDYIISECAKMFRKIKKIRVMSRSNANTVKCLKRIGFVESGNCLEKEIGEG